MKPKYPSLPRKRRDAMDGTGESALKPQPLGSLHLSAGKPVALVTPGGHSNASHGGLVTRSPTLGASGIDSPKPASITEGPVGTVLPRLGSRSNGSRCRNSEAQALPTHKGG